METKLKFRQPLSLEVIVDAKGCERHEDLLQACKPTGDAMRKELLERVVKCGYENDPATIQWDWGWLPENDQCVVTVWHAPEWLDLEMVGGPADGETFGSDARTPKRFVSLRETSTDVWCECGCEGAAEDYENTSPVVLDPFIPEWVTYERRGLTEDGQRWAYTLKEH